ncbi:MAG: MarR family transcriptional regulator [Nitrospira sp. WS110]|nr:MarR family transcriptional regulator [Nitrospira sp. WS110]
MTTKAHTLYQLIRQIRSGFNLLRVLGDDLHRDLKVTAAMRAIMETLAEDGEQTVPQIARAKSVSRQHIQVNVDALLRKALVVLRDNPSHLRSPFVALTPRGQATFTIMRRREAELLEWLAKEFGLEQLEQVSRTLGTLNQSIRKHQKKGGADD